MRVRKMWTIYLISASYSINVSLGCKKQLMLFVITTVEQIDTRKLINVSVCRIRLSTLITYRTYGLSVTSI